MMVYDSCHVVFPKTLLVCSYFVFALVSNCAEAGFFRNNFLNPSSNSHLIEKNAFLSKIKEMFYFGYENYMKHAYPEDELNPTFCRGRGHDFSDRNNININDVLGDYQLTLVDNLDTLAILGNVSEFRKAVNLIINSLSFCKDTIIQIFEGTIRYASYDLTFRVLGGLISAHLLITDSRNRFGLLRPHNYSNELLTLAHDLANRMMAAFESPTSIPFPRIHLGNGRIAGPSNETCLAGAGSLLLEFGTLSLLLNDSTYAVVAKRSVEALWSRRSKVTGLLGKLLLIGMRTKPAVPSEFELET
ncbi:unnamed protein product [Protopolystoma xenopodis]|uniref:alpha-1,2-Mannosidase n=1 Tax=Protopolystoma xenopodis TaxID=117903 RepID=A0A3S5CJH3_9PLAT|nr:unnamed protein product [Protopolystoma xenopodis]